MDVEIHTKHVFFKGLPSHALETIFPVRILAHENIAEAQETRDIQAISSFVPGIVSVVIGIDRVFVEAFSDFAGG